MTKLALSLLAFACALQADFNPGAWKFRRPLKLDGATSLTRVRLDSSVYRGSPVKLADLRVIRDGVEQPYLLQTLRGTSDEKELRPSVLNKSAVLPTAVEVTLDLGGTATHNRLRVSTPERNFKQRVRIETSADSRHWALSRDDGYIFDFSQGDRQVSVLTVDYPASNRRYVRATIFGWNNPKFLESALLTYRVEQLDTRETYVALAQPVSIQDSKTRSTLYTLDLGFEGLPYDQVQLDVDSPLFYRPVEMETSPDGKDWAHAGQGIISHTPEQQSSTITFEELWNRYIRLRITNRDDQPLRVRRIAVSTLVREVEFPARTAGQYWLYYGNPDATTPAYDLALAIPAHPPSTVPAVSMGPEQPVPEYRARVPDPKPWSDRHPALLYSVLGIAIGVMGILTIRFLAKVSRQTN